MKVVIVGLGNQGRKRVVCAGSDVVATIDPFESEAQYTDVKEVSLDVFDAAIVCIPDGHKLQTLEYLLSNGKHVLVEKPLLASSKECLIQIKDLAIENEVVCYTAYNHRFEPHIAKLKKSLDNGDLGKVYFAKLFYGNGTARDVRQSWRDEGMGVLSDLGSHLIDLTGFLFGKTSFEAWGFNRFENRSYDHVLFGSQGNPVLELEATHLSWRNTFTVDVWGERGSAHIDCLCKWGSNSFVTRRRSLPSGKPDEESCALECADPTWMLEYEHFKRLCMDSEADLGNDIWINDVLNEMICEVGKAQSD